MAAARRWQGLPRRLPNGLETAKIGPGPHLLTVAVTPSELRVNITYGGWVVLFWWYGANGRDF